MLSSREVSSHIFNEIEAYYHSGQYCDLSIFCRTTEADQLWISGDGFNDSGKQRLAFRVATDQISDMVEIKCHSLVLASLSKDLHNILKYSDEEQKTIFLPDINFTSVQSLLDQMYANLSGRSDFTFHVDWQLAKLFNIHAHFTVAQLRWPHQINMMKKQVEKKFDPKRAAKRTMKDVHVALPRLPDSTIVIDAPPVKVSQTLVYPDESHMIQIEPPNLEEENIIQTPPSTKKEVILKPVSKEEVMAYLEKQQKRKKLEPPLLAEVMMPQKQVFIKSYSQKRPFTAVRSAKEMEELERKDKKPKLDMKLSKKAQKSRRRVQVDVELVSKFDKKTRPEVITFLNETKLKFTSVGKTNGSNLDGLETSQGGLSLVTVGCETEQIVFECQICNRSDLKADSFVAHMSQMHQVVKPILDCHNCGKQSVNLQAYLSHRFQHRLWNMEEDNTIALVGLAKGNKALTIASNRWLPEKIMDNFFTALYGVYRLTSGHFHDQLYGKEEDSDQIKLQVEALQSNLKDLSDKQLGDKLNGIKAKETLFARLSPVKLTAVKKPQLPVFSVQLQADLNFQQDIPHHDILDMAIVLGNEAMSLSKMADTNKELTESALICLTRLLNCPSLDMMKSHFDAQLKAHFSDFVKQRPVFLALYDLLYTSTCDECGSSFLTDSALKKTRFERHVEAHSYELLGKEVCNCPLVLSNLKRRSSHFASVHGIHDPVSELPKTCECRATFLGLRHRVCHLKKVHNHVVPVLECPTVDCTDVFMTKPSLDLHLTRGKHSILTMCDECGKSFNSRAIHDEHKKTVHQEVECGKCAKSFVGKQEYKYHHDRCSKDKWTCEICQSELPNEEQLHSHRNLTHLALKPLIEHCDMCGKGFAALASLREHEKKMHARPPMPSGKHVRTAAKPTTRVDKQPALEQTNEADDTFLIRTSYIEI